MKNIIFFLALIALSFSTKAQFSGTDSLRNYNNRFITNNAQAAFTNLRLHNLLAGMIDWEDSARLGAGGTLGVDTIYAVNDSTIRYRKSGVFRTFIIRGTAWAGRIYEVPFSNGFGRFLRDSNFVYSNSTPDAGNLTVGPINVISGGLSKVNITSDNMNALALTAFGTGLNTVIARRGNGTVASPTNVLNGNDLWNFSGRGYTGTQWSGTRAAFYSRANQNWTDSTNGTFIAFQTTHNDSIVPYERFIIDNDGRVKMPAYTYLPPVTDTLSKPLVYNKNTGYIGVAANYGSGTGIDIRAFPPVNGMIALGDSYLYGYNADGPALIRTYMDVIASQFGITYTNLSVSGAQIRKEINQLFTLTTTTPSVPIMLAAGFNNFRGRVDSSRRIETVKAAYKSIIANQFAKTFEPPFGVGGVANPKYSFSASTTGATTSSVDTLIDWTSHVYWVRNNIAGFSGANWWRKASITANETITIDSLTGSNLYIQTWACDSGYTIMSRIQYAVDGVTLGTYQPNKKSWDAAETGFHRLGIINDAIVITGLRDTLHRIVLTFLDGGKIGGIDGVGVLLSPNKSLKQPAFIPSFPHMDSVGYAFVPPINGATQGSLDTATALCKADLQSVFAGYPIYFPDQNKYFNPNDIAQMQSDGIHRTSLGQYKSYLAILDEISPQKISTSITTPTLDAVATAGNTTSNAISITGNSSSANRFSAGAFEFFSFDANNAFMTRNIYFDGSTFRWRNSGYGGIMHMYQNTLAFRTFGNGSAGADAVSTLATPFVVSPSAHIGLGGNMSFDDNLVGATLVVRGDNKVNARLAGFEFNIYSGTLNIGQTSNNGNATFEVSGTQYLRKDQNGSTYIVVKNGSNGAAAQANLILYNDVDSLGQIGIASSGFTSSGTLTSKTFFINSNSVSGTLLNAVNGPIKFSHGSGYTESARFNTSGAFLLNRTSLVSSELLSVNGKINANADSTSTATGGYLYRAPNGDFKVTAAPITVLHGTLSSFTFPSISGGASTSTTVTVTGAVPGDMVLIQEATGGALTDGEFFDARVSANDTVTIRRSYTVAGTIASSTKTYNVMVLKN